MVEYGINEIWVENLWQKSKRTRLPVRILIDKDKKYGSKVQENFSYYRRCGYKLTVKFDKDQKPTLITITKIFSNSFKIR